jgi:hypothetical protein
MVSRRGAEEEGGKENFSRKDAKAPREHGCGNAALNRDRSANGQVWIEGGVAANATSWRLCVFASLRETIA